MSLEIQELHSSSWPRTGYGRWTTISAENPVIWVLFIDQLLLVHCAWRFTHHFEQAGRSPEFSCQLHTYHGSTLFPGSRTGSETSIAREYSDSTPIYPMEFSTDNLCPTRATSSDLLNALSSPESVLHQTTVDVDVKSTSFRTVLLEHPVLISRVAVPLLMERVIDCI